MNLLKKILGVAHNGLSRIGVENQDVLIIGAGAIGLLATSVAKAMGATKVMIADVNAERLELAKKMGADVTINCKEVELHKEIMRLTGGDGVPRLVEASGASALVNSCFKLLQKVNSSFKLVGLNLDRFPIGCTTCLYWTSPIAFACG